MNSSTILQPVAKVIDKSSNMLSLASVVTSITPLAVLGAAGKAISLGIKFLDKVINTLSESEAPTPSSKVSENPCSHFGKTCTAGITPHSDVIIPTVMPKIGG